MNKIKKSCIISFILFAFCNWYIIIQTCYGDDPTESEKLAYRYHNPKIRNEIDLHQYTLNPMDSHFSKLENWIIFFGYFGAMWYFADFVILAYNTKYPKCKNDTENIYISKFNEYIFKKFGRKKNE